MSRPVRGHGVPPILRPRLSVLLASSLLLASAEPVLAGAPPTRPEQVGPLPATSLRSSSESLSPWGCLPAVRREVLHSEGTLLRPDSPEPAGLAGGSRALETGPAPGADYRLVVATTALGRPRLDRWCVWIEPSSGGVGDAFWQSRWSAALSRALSQWRALLPIRVVEDPEAAQVRVWRRRPPLIPGPDGRLRASHGRASLSLERVRRGEVTRLEPAVEVLISPGQREQAIEATALHELGHAFGLWGHSEDPADVMAAVPGAQPVLVLSRRDRSTLQWLYQQSTVFGRQQAP